MPDTKTTARVLAVDLSAPRFYPGDATWLSIQRLQEVDENGDTRTTWMWHAGSPGNEGAHGWEFSSLVEVLEDVIKWAKEEQPHV